MKAVYLLVALLTGCATVIEPNQAIIELRSEPPGATFTAGDTGMPLGTAPVSKLFTFPGAERFTVSPPIIATWVSGAQTSMRINITPGKWFYVFKRPANAPGLDADVQWAIHLQQQQSVDAAEFNSAMYELGKGLGTIGGRR